MTARDPLLPSDTVAQLADMMLAAAQKRDWDRLAELEAYCAEFLQYAQAQGGREPLSCAALQRKLANLKRILAADREIRNTLQPRLMKLDQLLRQNAAC